jgi:glutamate---cysteine ligase / carboxylate-amine ligase
VSAETHQAAIELATDAHSTVGAAVAQLGELRAWLAAELDGLGLAVATAGTHPSAVWTETLVSPASRYQVILRTMADLARREPTFALHVHVGVPDPEAAIRLLNRLRAHLPLLLALSANSPFWQGRATGLASTRTPVFGAFPRTGLPRRFSSYGDWTDTVDTLLRCGAFPEPTFLWWDARPQPKLGTVEVRVMDAQTDLAATAALGALVQSIARLELEEQHAPPVLVAADELLAENRFLAARDGIDADFLDPVAGLRRPARAWLRELMPAARPHADALGCRAELETVAGLALAPPFLRQLDVAAREGDDLRAVTAELAAAF